MRKIAWGLLFALIGTAIILYSIEVLFGNLDTLPFLQTYISSKKENIIIVFGIQIIIGVLSLIISTEVFGWD